MTVLRIPGKPTGIVRFFFIDLLITLSHVIHVIYVTGIRRIFVGFATNRTFVKFEPIRSDRSPSVGYILFNKGITFLYKLYYTKDICNYYIF